MYQEKSFLYIGLKLKKSTTINELIKRCGKSEQIKEDVKNDVKAFLKNGGKIKKLKSNESKVTKTTIWY